MKLICNIDPFILEWVITPLLIFFARMIDVSISTVRIMLVVNERKKEATALSFIEMLIWLVAVTQTFKHLNNVLCYVAFAGGFSTGTYIGMRLEKMLSFGIVMVRAVTTEKDAKDLIEFLKKFNYRVTSIDAEGTKGHVNIVYTVINRKELTKVIGIIREFNPNAFYTVENIRYVSTPEQISSGLTDNMESPFITFLRRIKIK